MFKINKNTKLDGSRKFSVGDVIVYTYCYNASYPHFARIIRMSKSFVWLESIPKKWHESDGFNQNGTVVPNFDAPTSPIKGRYKIKHSSKYITDEDYDYIIINRCMGYIWDGTPQLEYTD